MNNISGEDESYAVLCTPEFLESLLDTNQQQRTQAFYEVALKYAEAERPIPPHWSLFMAKRLLAACDTGLVNSKSKSVMADSLGIGAHQDESRNIKAGILVGYYLAKQEKEYEVENITKASKKAAEILEGQNINLNYKTITTLFNDNHKIFIELGKIALNKAKASEEDVFHLLFPKY